VTDTIKRWECPECGRKWTPFTRAPKHHCARGEGCPGVPVERVYVAVEALPYREMLQLCVRAFGVVIDAVTGEDEPSHTQLCEDHRFIHHASTGDDADCICRAVTGEKT